MDTGSRQNPFSSDRVEPGRGGYIFSDTTRNGLNEILKRLESCDWRGELVGPHGAGKSTLLTDICKNLTDRKIRWVRWQCSDRQRLLPAKWRSEVRRVQVICIDGAERLWPGLLWLIKLQTRMRGKGLIVTLHRSKTLGTSISVEPDANCLNRKLQHLGMNEPLENTLGRLNKHSGDCREVLFDLYLAYEKSAAGLPDGQTRRSG